MAAAETSSNSFWLEKPNCWGEKRHGYNVSGALFFAWFAYPKSGKCMIVLRAFSNFSRLQEWQQWKKYDYSWDALKALVTGIKSLLTGIAQRKLGWQLPTSTMQELRGAMREPKCFYTSSPPGRAAPNRSWFEPPKQWKKYGCSWKVLTFLLKGIC